MGIRFGSDLLHGIAIGATTVGGMAVGSEVIFRSSNIPAPPDFTLTYDSSAFEILISIAAQTGVTYFLAVHTYPDGTTDDLRVNGAGPHTRRQPAQRGLNTVELEACNGDGCSTKVTRTVTVS